MHFDEEFLADEAGLFMLTGYILMVIPDRSRKLWKRVKVPGMKRGVAPIVEVLESAGPGH